MKTRNLINCKITKKLNGYLFGVLFALFTFTNTAMATETRVCKDISVKDDLPSFTNNFPEIISDVVFVYLPGKKIVYSMCGGKDTKPVTSTDPLFEENQMLISTTGSFKLNNKIQYKLYRDVKRKSAEEPLWRIQVSKVTPEGPSTEDIGLNCHIQE